MSYFYQHIKGYTSRGYSWKINIDELAAAPAGNWPMNTPTFLWNDGTNHDGGHLITSLAEYGRIKPDFYFLNKVYFCIADPDPDAPADAIGIYRGYIGHDSNGLEIRGGSSEGNSPVLNINASQVKYQGVQGQTQFLFQTPNTYTSTNTSTVNNTITYTPIGFYIQTPGATSTKYGFGLACFDTVDGYARWSAVGASASSTEAPKTKLWANVPIVSEDFILSRNYIVTTGYVKAYNYVEGLYFNATSDKRAKTGINQSTFSALNIIKSLPIYNFKYKSDGSDSIGIIAQEALNVNAGNFSLVANSQASGENGDYMSVKESKLVYIAWKAIQEQQEIIDKQSKEIEDLKQLVKTLIEK